MYIYKREWENLPEIGHRIRPDEDDVTKAICNICDKSICAQLSVIKKHLSVHLRYVVEAEENNEQHINEEQQIYEQRSLYKYLVEWENNPSYSNWIRRVEDDSTKAFCMMCKTTIVASSSSLQKHMASYRHYRNVIIDSGNQTGEYLHKSPRFNMQVAERELQVAAYIVERHYSFKSAESFVPFLKRICSESETISKMQMSRGKAQKLATRVICPVQEAKLIETLSTTKFSILVDEMTDISVDKCLCIVVLYWDKEKKDTVYRLWDMVSVYPRGQMKIIANAEHLFGLIKNSFEEANIPLSNILAFSSDTVNIMMGKNNSVASRLKENIPGIYNM